jgi:hypothetical protein
VAEDSFDSPQHTFVIVYYEDTRFGIFIIFRVHWLRGGGGVKRRCTTQILRRTMLLQSLGWL